MAGRAEVGEGEADGRGLERRVKHGHKEADHDEVSLVVVIGGLEHMMGWEKVM